jgi:hypothetical protein
MKIKSLIQYSVFYIAFSLLFIAHCPLLLLLPFPLYASDCQWVETIGEAVAENLTPDEARNLALNRARNKAIENVSGINISGNTLVKDYSLITDLIRVAGSGHILEERVIKWEQGVIPLNKGGEGVVIPITTYKVNLNTCVQGELSGDPYFKVRGELNRDVFMNGEEAEIKVTCTKDCYLTILNLMANNNVRILLPNEYEKLRKIKEGEEYNFPMQGLSLEIQLLPGHKKDAEAFILIATKERFDLLPLVKSSNSPFAKGGQGGIKIEDFYKVLITIPPQERTEEILLYEVRARE